MLNAIAFDGHDGTGKTTLSSALAKLLGGSYLRPFAAPAGVEIAECWGSGRFDEADARARRAVDGVVVTAGNGPFVFDRLWLTMFTVLPETYFNRWLPLTPTILCAVDVDTMVSRVVSRGEEAGDEQEHAHFAALYRSLAERFDVPVLDTSTATVAESLAQVLDIAAERAWLPPGLLAEGVNRLQSGAGMGSSTTSQ